MCVRLFNFALLAESFKLEYLKVDKAYDLWKIALWFLQNFHFQNIVLIKLIPDKLRHELWVGKSQFFGD